MLSVINQYFSMDHNNTRGLVRVAGKEISVPTIYTTGLQSISHITDWRVLTALFISSQDVKESSRSLYSRTLSQFFLWVESSQRDLNTLQRSDILEYKDSLLSSGLSALTISSYLVVVRKF